MKKLIVLACVAVIASCTPPVDFYPDDLDRAEEVCASNDGIKKIHVSQSLGLSRVTHLKVKVQCNNGVGYSYALKGRNS